MWVKSPKLANHIAPFAPYDDSQTSNYSPSMAESSAHQHTMSGLALATSRDDLPFFKAI
jgi:hypothetical protein